MRFITRPNATITIICSFIAELINCSLCGKEISSRAKACPHCGDPAKGVIKKSLSKLKVNTIAHAVRKGWLVKSTSGNRMAKTFYDKLDEEDPKPVRKRDKWDTSIAIFIMLK